MAKRGRSYASIIHRWAGLSIGLVAAIICITGSVVVLRDDAERWIAVDGEVAAGRGAYDPAVAAIAVRWPDARIDKLMPADAPGRPDAWRVSAGSGAAYDEEREKWAVFTDPSHGVVLGDTRGSPIAAAMRWTAEFHANLFLPGAMRDVVVGLSGLSLISFAITGLILWWPGVGKMARSLHLRLGKTPFLRHFDLHRVAAFAVLVPLLAAGLTGMFFAWNWSRDLAYRALGGGTAERPHQLLDKAEKRALVRDEAGTWTSLDALVASAAASAPGLDSGALLRVTGLGGKPGHPLKVAFDHPGNGDRRSGGVVVHMRPDGGGAVRVDDPRVGSPGHWLLAHQWALHAGLWGSSAGFLGMAARGAWVVAGIGILGLGITGVGIWWHRRRQQQAARNGAQPRRTSTVQVKDGAAMAAGS